MILLLLLGQGCGHEPDAAVLARALSTDSSQAAAEQCRLIRSPAVADECLATVVRQHADLEVCDEVSDPRWSGECWFSMAERRGDGAERRGDTGDRWGGLQACGRSGPFYDECLYHLWTSELSRAADAAPDAVAALDLAREPIAFWSSIQTIDGDASEQIWSDFWFFAHNAHRPADLATCARLDDSAEQQSCEIGTRLFVLRAVTGDLLAPGQPADLLDRICRSGEVPDVWTDDLYVGHADLDDQVDRVAALACKAARGEPVRRWNPVFRGRRQAGPEQTP